MVWLIAQNVTEQWQTDLKSVIFTGLFILACIAALIWWLRR